MKLFLFVMRSRNGQARAGRNICFICLFVGSFDIRYDLMNTIYKVKLRVDVDIIGCEYIRSSFLDANAIFYSDLANHENAKLCAK